MTLTGVLLSAKVPSPIRPKSPQHLAPPALVSAQLWKVPAPIATTPLPSPETSTGVRRFVVLPSPSSDSAC